MRYCNPGMYKGTVHLDFLNSTGVRNRGGKGGYPSIIQDFTIVSGTALNVAFVVFREDFLSLKFDRS